MIDLSSSISELKPYPQMIYDFFVDSGQLRGRSATAAKIYAAIILNQEVTQNDISYWTSLSRGVISQNLKIFESNQIIQKEFKPGTHTLVYSFTPSINELGLRSISSIFQYNLSIVRELLKIQNNLKSFSKESLFGKDLLLKRLQELIFYFYIETHIILDFSQEKELKQNSIFSNIEIPSINNYHLLTYPQFPMHNHHFCNPFSPEIKEIEKCILETLYNKKINFLLKETEMMIEGFFTTREVLYNSQLQELTNLSPSTIAFYLNSLVEQKKIEAVEIDYSTIRKYYSMPSICMKNLREQSNLYSAIVSYKNLFLEAKNYLNGQYKNLAQDPNYFYLYTMIDKILTYYIPRYERLLELTDKYIANVRAIRQNNQKEENIT